MFERVVVFSVFAFSALFSNRTATVEEVFESDPFIGSYEEAEAAREWENRAFLATYPRSGNHWMRYLVEEATGIATSSVYCDPDPQHMEKVFPWGGYCLDHGYEGNPRYPMEGEMVFLKTHFPVSHISFFDALPYKKTVRITRHPVDSFYSLYLWIQDFNKESAEFMIPREALEKYVGQWRRFQEYWDEAENVLTIRYEDLLENPKANLENILNYLGYQVSKEDIQRAVKKYPPTGKPLKHLVHFTEDDLEFIYENLDDLMEKHQYKN
ncbi:MAG: sulfotransferase domain-containing protein [Candidatus Algichlamydia australiensis]|nr:sulfotransferase domain-containing protein [Chlamydiales bacterium]